MNEKQVSEFKDKFKYLYWEKFAYTNSYPEVYLFIDKCIDEAIKEERERIYKNLSLINMPIYDSTDLEYIKEKLDIFKTNQI